MENKRALNWKAQEEENDCNKKWYRKKIKTKEKKWKRINWEEMEKSIDKLGKHIKEHKQRI